MTDHILTQGQTRNLLLQGKFIFTIQSRKTDKRFTFKVIKAKAKDELFFISVLNGPNNNHNYSYFGHIWLDSNTKKYTFCYAKPGKSRITREAESVKFFTYFLSELRNNALENRVDIYHEERCARCGRRLTTPESVLNGIGPECIKIQRFF